MPNSKKPAKAKKNKSDKTVRVAKPKDVRLDVVFAGPLHLDVTFYLAKPKSAPKRGSMNSRTRVGSSTPVDPPDWISASVSACMSGCPAARR